MARIGVELREAAARAFAAARAADLARLPEDLFAFARILDGEPRLRRALTDPGVPADARTAMLSDLLGDRLTAPAMPVLAATLELQRTEERQLVPLVRELAAEAAFAVAEAGDDLDRVQDELFRLAVALEGSAELQMALADPGIPQDRKVAVLEDITRGAVAPTTALLVRLVLESGRSRDLARALHGLVDLAAARAGRLTAEVRTAVPLDERRSRILAETLERAVGRPVRVQQVVDPGVVGSLAVRVGDEVFDGSVARQLELARERLVAAR